MKKIILFLSVITLITSCSSDADPLPAIVPLDVNSVLVKKIIETEPSSNVITAEYTYNGNKLVKISYSDGTYDNYTYTNNLITKEENFTDTNVISETSSYTYNASGQLVNYVNSYGSTTVTINYTHNSDGTISYQEVGGNAGKFYPNKWEEYTTSPAYTYIYSFTYDGKNNPKKNILGIDKIWFADSRETLFNSQNVVSQNELNSLGNFPKSSSTFSYDANNFPTVEMYTNYSAGGSVTKYEYFY